MMQDDNDLTGSIPSELGNLFNLNYLTFGMCDFIIPFAIMYFYALALICSLYFVQAVIR